MRPALLAISLLLLSGCYSFRQGSAPAHLKTVTILPSEDASSYGRGSVRQELTTLLERKFRDDNSLRVVTGASADSQIESTIVSITNERASVSSAEFETVRNVVISVRARFVDNIRRRPVYETNFTGRAPYNIGEGIAGEEAAIGVALDNVTTEILNAAVANW